MTQSEPYELLAPRETLISDLKPHPRNYRHHPDEQLEHIGASIEENGFYRNVVVAADGTILAGHGVVEAATKAGGTAVNAVWLDCAPDSPQALKVMTGDNYLGQFASDDDRILTDILREVSEVDSLIGTGFDESNLAALVMVTRDKSEIKDFDEAAEWAGMPEYESDPERPRLAFNCESLEAREDLVKRLGIRVMQRHNIEWSVRWPSQDIEDIGSLRITDDPEETPL